jgi:hypothetical protein
MAARWTIGEQSFGRLEQGVARRKTRGIVDVLLVFAVIALMSLSNFALEFLGIPYNSLGGSIVAKIHPATYLICLALGLAVIANRNPVVYALDLLLRCLGSTFLLLACLLLWMFISRYKPDYTASFLIDSLMATALLFILFADAGPQTRLTVARVVHVIMVVNCLVAIVEGLSGWRLFPFVLTGRDQTWEYRATALLGHPLIGALITGVYAVILMTVKDVRGLGKGWRGPIVLLCLVTMPFIGSRTSFTVVYATAAAIIALRVLRFLRGEAVSVRKLLVLLALIPLVVCAVAALINMGLFDNFVGRFMHDKGSAESRVQVFNLFDNFNWRDLIVGQSSAVLDTNVRLNGLTEGIENSWVGLVVRYGLAMSIVVWFGVAGWIVDMLRSAGRGAILPLAFVILIISTTVGISGKTTMLSIPEILILALIVKRPDDVASPSDRDLPSSRRLPPGRTIRLG